MLFSDGEGFCPTFLFDVSATALSQLWVLEYVRVQPLLVITKYCTRLSLRSHIFNVKLQNQDNSSVEDYSI